MRMESRQNRKRSREGKADHTFRNGSTKGVEQLGQQDAKGFWYRSVFLFFLCRNPRIKCPGCCPSALSTVLKSMASSELRGEPTVSFRTGTCWSEWPHRRGRGASRKAREITELGRGQILLYIFYWNIVTDMPRLPKPNPYNLVPYQKHWTVYC